MGHAAERYSERGHARIWHTAALAIALTVSTSLTATLIVTVYDAGRVDANTYWFCK